MKKLNKKGFTLIELLAVIVVLAIIMVIAGTSVIKTINKSRAESFDRSMDMVVNNAKTLYAQRANNGFSANDLKEVTDNDSEISITYSDGLITITPTSNDDGFTGKFKDVDLNLITEQNQKYTYNNTAKSISTYLCSDGSVQKTACDGSEEEG